MAYIGREPTVGNFQVCDAISVVNGQAAYTMQVSSVNVSPETANHMLVSLNGVLQQPNSSFTVSGSTITFASNLVTGDVIDFIHILGSVLDLGVPSDSTVSLAKLTATGTKDATTFLRGDNTFASAQGAYESQLLHVRDEKSASTDAGTATGGQFTKRTLNTVKTNEITGASLSSDQITLPAGTYYMFGLAPANRCNGHKTRLRNVTDSSTAIVGLNTHTSSGQDIDDDKAFCIGRFTISGQKVFEFQHYVTTTRSSDGFGIASTASAGEVAVYADVQIWKVG